MRQHKLLTSILAGMAFAFSISAQATIISLDDRVTFEALGTINEFQDFEGFDANNFSSPGDPWVDGSISYESGSNLVVGSGTFVGPLSNTLSNDTVDVALQGSISGAFDMFAMDMAVNDSGVVPPTTLTLFTNMNTYLIDLILPDVQTEQLFQGWTAMSGEYFTGFHFEADNFVHIDNVTLGTLSAVSVPEPSTLLLIGIGVIGLFGYRRTIS